VAETSNWYSQHNTSNISAFDSLFLGESPSVVGGKYFTRSPVIMYTSRVRTPVLHTTGALDRCTPPGQAIEFHRALVEHSVESECVIYPHEGHGVRQFPAVIDHMTRVLDFLQTHLHWPSAATSHEFDLAPTSTSTPRPAR
jgi:dipeptidyl aminopeptidase/acylaminoacyl peptidase